MPDELHLWYWLIPDERRPGRMRRTTWRMTEETARGYPGAVKIEETLEIRQGSSRAHSTGDFDDGRRGSE